LFLKPRMATIHLLHGFNVSDGGRKTVGQLTPYFELSGHAAKTISYGWIGLMGAWFINPRIAEQLISHVGPDDLGCGHSNGCTVLHRAAHLGAPFRGLIYINPALRQDAAPSSQVKWVDVYFNDGDHAVKLAAILRLLAPWAPLGDPLWGDMGARGSAPSTASETYAPQGAISHAIHWFNLSTSKQPWLLWMLRVTVGLPFSLIYMLIVAPFEVLLTVYHNNIRSPSIEGRLAVSRVEDARFVVVGLFVPIAIWITVL
jgi:hypothetical protein